MTQRLTSTEELPGADASSRVEGVGAAAAAARANARVAVEAAERAFPGWSATPPTERRGLLRARRRADGGAQADVAELVAEETAAPWLGHVQRAARGRHARRLGRPRRRACRRGDPSHISGQAGDARGAPAGRGGRRHRAVERPGHSRDARGRRAARLRQHGRAQGLGECPRTHGAIVEALKDAGLPPESSTWSRTTRRRGRRRR